MMADDVVSRLQKYKEQTKTDGETLVRTVFPKRVFEMEQLLATKLFNFPSSAIYKKINLPVPLMGDRNGSVETCDSDGDKASTKPPGCPVYTFPGGVVPHNEHIKEMIETTKPHLTQLMVEAQLVRLWIQFNVPRIEDGNNFGVGIQEEVLSEASGIERDALTFLDQFTRYYASRGKLVGKAAKFPHIDDYRECIRDMDEKQAISMRYVIMEIRNHYAVLHDLIVKNIDRIKVPRSNNTMTMY
uniref:Proteasome activator complex subunit 3 n=1 Tax=Mesocestoides corti TaxID=53468 RepID=A0A5K3EZT2_MESCO